MSSVRSVTHLAGCTLGRPAGRPLPLSRAGAAGGTVGRGAVQVGLVGVGGMMASIDQDERVRAALSCPGLGPGSGRPAPRGGRFSAAPRVGRCP